MTKPVKITVPDLGGATDVEVIEMLVSVGDAIAVEDSLITVESDKASMDIPASAGGTIIDISVSVGDSINEGDLILTLEASGQEQESPKSADRESPAAAPKTDAAPSEKAAAPSESSAFQRLRRPCAISGYWLWPGWIHGRVSRRRLRLRRHSSGKIYLSWGGLFKCRVYSI